MTETLPAVPPTWAFDRPEATFINAARITHLFSLGLPLAGKRVLEVGAGVGRLSLLLEAGGCVVTATEGRAENVTENIRRNPWRQGQAFCVDVMEPGGHRRFLPVDVILCYGLLYHLADPAAALRELGALAVPLIAVESQIIAGSGPALREHKDNWDCDQSLDRRASHFTLDWLVEAIRAAGWPVVTVPRRQPDHPDFRGQSGDRHRRVVLGSYAPLELQP